MDIRGDTAKDIARVVRDGSTPEGRRLREQLWVWLHLQDEEATEPVPKQLQSWLTGQRTQQRKKFKRNRRRHSSQTDLIEIFSAPRIITHAVRQGLRTTTPTNLDVTENWDATTVTGRDKLEDILKRQKPWMTILNLPCAPFLDMFGLNERLKDSQGQVRTQRNALELLEVAMWVALTQHQTGRKLLFEHPAYASSWNTQMVSLVTGLEGVMLITVDLCALGMIDEDERSHCRMTTIMTNDSVVADAFRPYRCAQDHSFATAGSRHCRGTQEHDRRFCEILTTALKASLLNRDRREPRQLMTLTVRNDDDQEEDSGLDEEIVSLKNRRGNRGGFTPYQLVIGQNPRVPHELLSDDAVDEVGMQELSRDDADLDSPAKAFRQSVRIRDHALMLMETHMARERLRSAGRAQLHRDRTYHCVAKRLAWSKRSNRPSIAFSVGRSRTCCSARRHHGLGVDERTTLEVRPRANS